jgi:hypothetical protein
MNKLTSTCSSLLVVLSLAACNEENKGTPDGGVQDGLWPDGISRIDTDNKCAEISRKAELPPVDMLLALDTSDSMNYLQKWPSVKAALKAFVADSRFAYIGMGLQYFPLRAQCKVGDYATPAVPIGPLLTTAGAIASSLDEQRMSGGTPMVPMLQGVIDYTRGYAEKNPDRRTVVVLATDGIPDTSCIAGSTPNTLANVVAVAQAGASGKPAVPTFVIGVGSELTALDQIAQAGGTTSAFLVDTSKDIQSAFLTALNDIRRELACEYKVPPPPSSEIAIDYAAVKVRYTSGGASEYFVNVGKQESCAQAGDKGWYYDDPKKPTKILLCPATCKKASSTDDSQVDVVFGCKAVPA